MIPVTLTVFVLKTEHRVYMNTGLETCPIAIFPPNLAARTANDYSAQLNALSGARQTVSIVGEHVEPTFDDLSLTIGAALIYCGSDPAAIRLILVDVNALPDTIGKTEISAIAALYGVLNLSIFSLQDEASLQLAASDTPALIEGPNGPMFCPSSNDQIPDLASKRKPIETLVQILRSELEQSVIGSIDASFAERSLSLPDFDRKQGLAMRVADRLIALGDYGSQLSIEIKGSKELITFCAIEHPRCLNALKGLITHCQDILSSVDCILVGYDASSIFQQLTNPRQISVPDAIAQQAITATNMPESWRLGIKLEANFRGALSIMRRFDSEHRMIVLESSDQESNTPILLPPNLLKGDHIDLCYDTGHQQSQALLPLSKSVQSENTVVCYARPVSSTSYATVFDFRSNVTQPHKLVLCHETDQLVMVQNDHAANTLSAGFEG